MAGTQTGHTFHFSRLYNVYGLCFIVQEKDDLKQTIVYLVQLMIKMFQSNVLLTF